MATWKRIFTEDDVSSVNISNTELTTTTSGRSLSLYSGTSSNFTIKGRMQDTGSSSAYFNSMYVRAQNNAYYTNKEQNYVFFPTLRVGKPGQVGTAGNNGYKFPSVDAGVTDGELMVTKSFNASTGQLDFLTFGQWMKPTGDGIKASGAVSGYIPEGTVDQNNDSVLLYDDTNDEFGHVKVIDLAAAVSSFSFIPFGSTVNNTGTSAFLKGVNGVQHTATYGWVAPANFTITGMSAIFKKTAGGSSQGTRLFTIYKNGSATTGEIEVDASGSAPLTASGAVSFASNVSVSSGDILSVRVKNGNSNTGGTVDDMQVILRCT